MLESLCIADKDFDTTAWAHNENWIFEYSTEHIIDHAQRWLSLKSLKDHTALTDKRIFRYWTSVVTVWCSLCYNMHSLSQKKSSNCYRSLRWVTERGWNPVPSDYDFWICKYFQKMFTILCNFVWILAYETFNIFGCPCHSQKVGHFAKSYNIVS